MFRIWISLLTTIIPLVSGAQNIDLLILNRNYPEALVQIENQLADSTDTIAAEAELYFKQATVYRQLSDHLKAAKSLEQAMAIDTTSSKYQAEYADLQAELGNFYQAIKFYQKAVVLSPDDMNLKYKLGRAYQYEKAKDPYESYLSKNDSIYDVLKNYGITLFFCKNEEKAIVLLEKCFYQVPNDQYVNFYLGLAYKNLAKYSRSAEFLNMAIASAQPPYLSEMYHHLGQVFGYNREFEKSIEALQKAFDYNNENVETLFEIATTYEEFKSDKNFALKAYSNYVKRAGDKAPNAAYSLQRIKKIKEDLFVVNK